MNQRQFLPLRTSHLPLSRAENHPLANSTSINQRKANSPHIGTNHTTRYRTDFLEKRPDKARRNDSISLPVLRSILPRV